MCTAPKTGHVNVTARRNCPACSGAGSWGRRKAQLSASPAALAAIRPGPDMDAAIAQAVAESPDVSPDDLDVLAGHSNARVRGSVARSANLAESTMRALAQDPQVSVLSGVAQNRNLPADLARTLADGPEYVRQSLAVNDATPDDVVTDLATDSDARVSASAKARVVSRMCARLGVDPANDEAVAALMELEWWTAKADDPSVQLVLVLHRNR